MLIVVEVWRGYPNFLVPVACKWFEQETEAFVYMKNELSFGNLVTAHQCLRLKAPAEFDQRGK